MTTLTNFVAAMEADAGISALVGDRIYPAPAPDAAAMPFITYQVISEIVTGSGAQPCEEMRIQVTPTDTSYATMKALSAAVKTFALTNGHRYSAGADLIDIEAGTRLYYQPVDVFVN